MSVLISNYPETLSKVIKAEKKGDLLGSQNKKLSLRLTQELTYPLPEKRIPFATKVKMAATQMEHEGNCNKELVHAGELNHLDKVKSYWISLRINFPFKLSMDRIKWQRRTMTMLVRGWDGNEWRILVGLLSLHIIVPSWIAWLGAQVQHE